ncbi:XRE family transcriptional regulator [Longimycelium tulufanense]|uniref:XRE family transcriptional regulator n=1 Tax=Longimycelium tulufanense TaxID=907463 RepID=A0A8J3CKF5_9PSEU|nr:helix-turn-helix transcriptional regulator [Longimycelium tulufanense]GGM76392.1 XRE family transcriptional regulator [Longimycelium tulufanense]
MGDTEQHRRLTLAAKIQQLRKRPENRRPDGKLKTYRELATECAEVSGEPFSPTYMWQLAKGERDNPTLRHLEALAKVLGVRMSYFLDDTPAEELELALMMRDAGVRAVAARAMNWSPDQKAWLVDLMESIDRREQARRADQDNGNSTTG